MQNLIQDEMIRELCNSKCKHICRPRFETKWRRAAANEKVYAKPHLKLNAESCAAANAKVHADPNSKLNAEGAVQ